MPAAHDDTAGSPPFVSVVMCTRNRDEKIASAVESILALDYPAFDLTIIDQSTTDATGRAVAEIAGGDERVHYVHTVEPGLSRAYNNGIRRAKGEILAFTDDDCLAPRDWLTRIVAAFESEPDGDLLYGSVVAAGDSTDDHTLTPSFVIEAPRRQERRGSDGSRGTIKVFGMGANFAARSRLFDAIGLFDEKLGGGGPLWSSQDSDLTYRTFVADRVTLLRPEVVIRHDGRREEEDWPALLLAYGSGDGAFYTKHVRCGDPYASWLLTKIYARGAAKIVHELIWKRATVPVPYFKGLIRGTRASFRFGVDRRTRLYLDK